ncbi:MAG: pyridoxamine 5'-phosphate oxidase family protein, partial [Phoenicibacter congonensis]|nr:pyridoxamine 5'-phosphate oxidase family protein [Phoenicibacter congonensis]
MRRSEREVKEISEIKAIVDECKVLHLAMQDEEGLYIVPLNFGYSFDGDKFEFYCHSARKGRKIDAIANNAAVAFEMDCEHGLVEADKTCGYSYTFASIIGSGKAILLDGEEKKKALTLLMKHQTGKDFEFNDKQVAAVSAIKIEVEDLSAKAHRSQIYLRPQFT